MIYNNFLNYLLENKGLYVAVQFNENTKDNIQEFIRKYKIPSGIEREDTHCTLIYSTVYDDVQINEEIEEYCSPKELIVFDTRDGKRALVISLNSDYLENRHIEIMKDSKLVYDYDKYIPHITLSYDIGNYTIPEDIVFPKDDFLIIGEYKEDLKVDNV